jgi:hypothetical protein
MSTPTDSLPIQARKLGGPLTVLRSDRTLLSVPLFLAPIAVFFLVQLVLLILIGVIPIPDEGWPRQRVFLLLGLAVLACLVSVPYAVLAWRRWRERFVFGDIGFAHLRAAGVYVYRWEEIESISHDWTVRRRDGSVVSFPRWFDDPTAVVRLLRKGWIEPKVNEHLDGLAAGREYEFPPLTLTPTALRQTSVELPWKEFSHFDVVSKQAVLHLFRKGMPTPWFALPLATVKNFHILVALITDWSAGYDPGGRTVAPPQL